MAIKVTGLRETQAALREIDKNLAKLAKEDLAKASQPVADSARHKISRFRGARVNRIRPVVTGRAVYVRQSESKRTGKRGDFGSLQWELLSDALTENEGEVRDNVEEALIRIIHRAGF